MPLLFFTFYNSVSKETSNIHLILKGIIEHDCLKLSRDYRFLVSQHWIFKDKIVLFFINYDYSTWLKDGQDCAYPLEEIHSVGKYDGNVAAFVRLYQENLGNFMPGNSHTDWGKSLYTRYQSRHRSHSILLFNFMNFSLWDGDCDWREWIPEAGHAAEYLATRVTIVLFLMTFISMI